MQTQTVFQAGNSSVVAIPKHLVKELGLKVGEKVIVSKAIDGESVVIRKVGRNKVKKLTADNKFRRWLDTFLRENAEILDELALR